MTRKIKQLWVDPSFKQMVKISAAKDNISIAEWTRLKAKNNKFKEVSFDFKF